MNGIQSVDNDLLAVVSGSVLNRNIQNVIRNRRARTYIFPGTVTTICMNAFEMNTNIVSVRLNDGLKILKQRCF